MGARASRATACKGEVVPQARTRTSTSASPLPLKHSSLWLRSSAGYVAGDDRDEPFANFYFGGFGNNWVDHREEKRYRESRTAFPASS